MRNALDILKAAALTSCLIVAAFVCLLLFQVSAAVKDSRNQVLVTARAVDDTLVQLQGTIKSANVAVTGATKLENDARYTLVEVNRNVLDERKMYELELPAVVAHVNGVLTNVQVATGDLHPLLLEVKERTHALEEIENSATKVMVDADMQVNDPHLAAAVANLDASTSALVVTSKASAATMVSVQAMAADGQHQVHALVYPKPIVSIANWSLKVVHAIGGWW